MDILLVEDDKDDAQLVEIALGRCPSPFCITHVTSLSAALDTLDQSRFEAIVVDLNLPDATDSESVDRLMLARCNAPVIVLSGNDDQQLAERMVAAGAQDVLPKGADGFRALSRAIRFGAKRKAAELKLRHLASYDPLTGLANRQEFYNQLEKACAHSERQGDLVLLLLLDLDRFKHANDLYGHEMGDTILKTVGRRIERQIRVGDTAARLGGDEFAIALEGVRDIASARRWAGKLLADLSRPVTVGTVSYPISASIGGALFPSHGKDADSLMRNADIAMYRVKNKGRNGIAVYDEHMNRRQQRTQTLESELRVALSEGRIDAAFQPRVSLVSGAVIGFEALCRWRRPNGDSVPPSEFIPIAQKHRLISAIGRQMRLLAMQASKRWTKVLGVPLPISVNVDSLEISADCYAERFLADARDAGCDPSLFSVEITETTLLEHTETTIDNIMSLSKHGVGIELDDFGAGHSSLRYLSQYPISTIKLDRCLLEGLGTNQHDKVIVQTIVELGKKLAVEVVAEGVETRLQLRELLKLGCDSAQGFLIARPMSVPDCSRWLESQAQRTASRFESMTGVFETPSNLQQEVVNEKHSG